MFPLNTERLILRDIVADDLPAVHEYASDSEVVRFMDWGPSTEQESHDYIQKTLAQQRDAPRYHFDLAVVLRSSGQLIGGCGLSIPVPAAPEGVIGYCLNRRYWGQGYASEAACALLALGFGPLALHRITAECDAENRASAHVLEKIGMRREGRFLENALCRGEWRDSFFYAILEHEWHSIRTGG